MLFWLKFHQNTTKILSKYHPNSIKYHKNCIKIPVLSTKKWVVFHRNNSGKHAVYLEKIGGSIPMVFQWNSIKIPLWFQMFTSGVPAEFLWNTALKFQHFSELILTLFYEITHSMYSSLVIIQKILKILISCQKIEASWVFSESLKYLHIKRKNNFKLEAEISLKWSFWKSKI